MVIFNSGSTSFASAVIRRSMASLYGSDEQTYMDPVQKNLKAGPECTPGLYWSERPCTERKAVMKLVREMPSRTICPDLVTFDFLVTSFDPQPTGPAT